MTSPPKKRFLIQTVLAGKGQFEEIDVIGEAPVTITVNGELWLTFMCTPLDLEALAIGFLFNERIINSIEEVSSVYVCQEKTNIDVWLEHPVDKPKDWSKTSGCTGGMTSVIDTQTSIDNSLARNSNGVVFDFTRISDWVVSLIDSQGLYREVGGVHTSILIDEHGIVMVTEDIGRHNTLDKIAGHCLLEHIDSQIKIIITTGRVSSEMLHKAARIGATVLISRTSPTSLSIELANKYGITLIGYARRDQFKIYSHPNRILLLKNAVISESRFSE